MKISIRALVTAPLLLLTLIPALIVGSIFHHYSQKAVKQIAEELLNQISDRTLDQIQVYLETPHLINEINANSIELGFLDPEDYESTEKYFFKQLQAAHQTDLGFSQEKSDVIESINHMYVGTEEGKFSGAEYSLARETIVVSYLQNKELKHYLTNEDGEPIQELAETETSGKQPFIPKNRPWYKEGKNLWFKKRKAGWSNAYCDQSTLRPVITAVRPYTAEGGKFLGVLGSDFLFSDLDTFLANILEDLEIRGGKILVLNKENEVWIESNGDQQQKCVENQELEFDKANDSIIQFVNESSEEQKLEMISFEGNKFFSKTLEIRDVYKTPLSSIVILIPESSFTSEIKAGRQYAVLLSFLILAVTGTLGLIVSRKIIDPVEKLGNAAKRMTNISIISDESVQLDIDNPSELHSLAKTFETMSEKLKELLIAFGYFVPQNFLNVLGCNDATEVKLGSYKRARMTILFSDIRSFTALNENLTPEQSFQFINSYLKRMEPAINENQGFVDKYIGDAIMALFEGDDNADHAVQASLGMLKRLEEYNKTRTTKSRPPIKIGIGVHQGEITLGTLGGLNRWDTTVIGSDVNKASRVESLTKDLGASLLISQETLNALQRSYLHRYLGKFNVRGISEPVNLYEIYNADSVEILRAKERTSSIFQEGLGLYTSKQYSKALEKFKTVLEECSEDGAAKFYLNKCQDREL